VNHLKTDSSNWAARSKKNTMRLGYWTGTWLVTMAVATFGPLLVWQSIQLEAMALSLGVGLVVGLGYSMMDVTNLIAFDAQISHLVILVGLTYGTGVFVGLRKYR